MSTTVDTFIPLLLNNNNSTLGSAGNTGGTSTALGNQLNFADLLLSPTTAGQNSSFNALLSIGTSSPTALAASDSMFSPFFSLFQEVVPASENSATGGFSPDALTLMGAGGPLPAFLNALNAKVNYTPAQQSAL